MSDREKSECPYCSNGRYYSLIADCCDECKPVYELLSGNELKQLADCKTPVAREELLVRLLAAFMVKMRDRINPKPL